MATGIARSETTSSAEGDGDHASRLTTSRRLWATLRDTWLVTKRIVELGDSFSLGTPDVSDD
jgi:hypothetical protein